MSTDKSGRTHKGKGPGGGQFTSTKGSIPSKHADSETDIAHRDGTAESHKTAQIAHEAAASHAKDFGDHENALRHQTKAQFHKDTAEQKSKPKQTRPEQIREWVKKQFNPKYHDSVTDDLIDVAAGNREGNDFEKEALKKIFGS